ncbi:hypothetical protein B0O99DRAFT_627321 [Bisporella sp. PMI_857]|nr:hypothetical protein B0O99DRAFT_627321 [Bisporella sp. PMI_857]
MVYGTSEEIEQMRPRNTMLHRSCFENVPINIFMAQVVADLYELEVIIVMPLWEGKYHPVLIRGVKSGEQVLLHIDEKGEWHSIRPLVRIPRHYRFPTPIQDCNTPVEDKEDWTLQEGLHMQLSRCPYVKYPFMKVVEPLDGLTDENDRLNLIMFKLDAPLRTKPYFPPVTVERVQVLRRVAWGVRPLLLPSGQTETDDEKIPGNVFEERDQEDIDGVFPFPFDTPLGSA